MFGIPNLRRCRRRARNAPRLASLIENIWTSASSNCRYCIATATQWIAINTNRSIRCNAKDWSALTRLFGVGRLLSSAFSADEWAANWPARPWRCSLLETEGWEDFDVHRRFVIV